VGADIGAVLLFPERTVDQTDPNQLRIVSYCAPRESPYRRASTKLSADTLQQREAILATHISSEPHQSEFGTLHEMGAKSVICAPIRSGDHIHGLLHVYSLQSLRELDADALELVLAVGDHLATILDNLDEKESLTANLQRAEDQYSSLRRLLEIESDLVGESVPMRRLRDTIARVAASDVTVLVRGESGVGKELVARAIHFNSGRRKGPFVCLNCAALTETLLESELFGHEKGAFTGAAGRKIGKFEQAHQGTLLLDEVGEMPLSTQAKFLRVLEGHSFERVGGDTSVCADARVVAATNRDLETAVEAGEFRRDLLYRLQVIEVHVPPLREHASDVPALAEHLLQLACQRTGRPKMRFSAAAMERLRSHDWPGNVRELRNVVERAVVLVEGSEITEGDLWFTPLSGSQGPPADVPGATHELISLEEVERLHILRTIESTNWKKREAARSLGINRSTLDRKLEKYGIRPPETP
jgi:Nif-specific regulatory protein